MTRRILLVALGMLVVSLAAPFSAAGEAPFVFQTDMYGFNVVPPVETGAWGFVRFFFSEDRLEADYTVDVKGISGTLVEGADLRYGPPGGEGPVVRHLAGSGFIVTSGRLHLTPEELADLVAGNYYVTVYTKDHPGGELRGQVYVPPGFLPGTTPNGTERSFAGIPAPTEPGPAPAPAPEPSVAPPRASITPPNTGEAGLSSERAARSVAAGVAVMVIGVGLLFLATPSRPR
ncbi:MAG TPA: CHRD domain-containing protein [Dehalococcoidia bacterium]|nr:CHRD domain-containing protein [Dehalococcoidia bacterium]